MSYTSVCLDKDQTDWVYEMWCIGATQIQIADALHISYQTVRRVLDGKPKIRPILTYNPNWKKEGIRF